MGPATSDADAFAAFVRSSARSLFGTAYLLTGDGNRAEELVQDTLARLYPRWPRIGALEAPLAYARRALANRFISQQRRPMSRELVMADLPEAAERRDLADEVTDRGMLSQLLRTLPERQRTALVLRYFHDLPDEEIGAALGCRPATVRSLLSRGLATMRERTEQPHALRQGGEQP
jgi:RNA polymerase sigma-70 factor (sigma-E family)